MGVFPYLVKWMNGGEITPYLVLSFSLSLQHALFLSLSLPPFLFFFSFSWFGVEHMGKKMSICFT